MFLIEQFIYQPFFNLLVLFYALLDRIPNLQADMGLAVILFTISIRVLMLPLSIASNRSAKERHEIQQTILKYQQEHRNAPQLAKAKVRTLFKTNRRVLISETINFIIQVIIFFILYRIFTTGLEGEDFHLLYSFMPEVEITHESLVFLGRYDLTKPSLLLNILQSLSIVAAESMSLINSPFPITRNDVVRDVIILPLGAFILFLGLPSGKKLFIITTLMFSFFFMLTMVLTRVFSRMFSKVEQKQAQTLATNLQQPNDVNNQIVE